MRYIGPQFFNGFNTLFEINGLPPTDVDAFPNTMFRSVMYHDLRFDFDVAKDQNGREIKFYFGVDNVFDKGVPQGAGTATGGGQRDLLIPWPQRLRWLPRSLLKRVSSSVEGPELVSGPLPFVCQTGLLSTDVGETSRL